MNKKDQTTKEKRHSADDERHAQSAHIKNPKRGSLTWGRTFRNVRRVPELTCSAGIKLNRRLSLLGYLQALQQAPDCPMPVRQSFWQSRQAIIFRVAPLFV